MLYTDITFANRLSTYLQLFKQKGDYLWNFRCPICGDSKTKKTKTRGYIYKVKTGLFVRCHNCGYSTNLGNFIKYLDPVLYKEYALEKYKESGLPRSHHIDTDVAIPEIIKKPELTDSVLDSIKRLDKLRPNHPAVDYVLKRKIPLRYLSLLYFAPRFRRYVNILLPGKFSNEKEDHPRLIIPYFNSFGKCFAFQGRSFGGEEPKYFTIKLDEDVERIYGLERVNYSKSILAVEGPLDSLFLPNCVAVSGSSFDSPTLESLKPNLVIVPDNEPRSRDITRIMNKNIDKGYAVCFWPDNIQEKDINEMVMAGRSIEEIMDIINNNSYNGIEAKLRFSSWKKC